MRRSANQHHMLHKCTSRTPLQSRLCSWASALAVRIDHPAASAGLQLPRPEPREPSAHPAEPTEGALNSRCPGLREGLRERASERGSSQTALLESLQWALHGSLPLSLSLRSRAPLYTEAWVEDGGGARLRGTGPDAPRSTQRSVRPPWRLLCEATFCRGRGVRPRASLIARLC